MRQLKQPFMVEFSGTPEAGKSTAILSVSNMLKTIGYKTMILKESAESLPDEFKREHLKQIEELLTVNFMHGSF